MHQVWSVSLSRMEQEIAHLTRLFKKEVEELLIRKTLEATAGDKNMTAKLLGINSRTIYRKLDKKVEKDAPELE